MWGFVVLIRTNVLSHKEKTHGVKYIHTKLCMFKGFDVTSLLHLFSLHICNDKYIFPHTVSNYPTVTCVDWYMVTDLSVYARVYVGTCVQHVSAG